MPANPSGWVQTFLIPGNRVTTPGLEYKIEVKDGKGHTQVFGPKVISVFDVPKYKSERTGTNFPNDHKIKTITIDPYKDLYVIHWDDLEGADYYQVFINNQLVIETPVNFFPSEEKINQGEKILIKAIRNEKIIAEKEKF